VNKWDLARQSLRDQQKDQKHKTDDRQLMEEYREYLDAELKGLSYAPVAFITAKEGRNVPALLDLCRHLHKAANERVSTGQLNAALEQAMAERTPGGVGGRARPKVYYATQVEVDPPHIVLFVNDPAYFNESYRRFLLNRFRDLLPFEEVPIRLTLRARNRPGDPADGAAPRRGPPKARSAAQGRTAGVKKSERPSNRGRRGGV
jgi:GTP-binding protein